MPITTLLGNAWQAQRHAALSGCGFTLAIGWLWFEELRALWLPEQTGNFGMLALAGFGATLCGTSLLLHFRRGASFPVPFAHLTHGAALVVLLAAWLLQPWPWAFALLVGMSGAGTSIFWLAHMLRPTPCHTLNTLVWAGGASLFLAWGAAQVLSAFPLVPVSSLWLLAALCPALAWLLSFGLPNHSLSGHNTPPPSAPQHDNSTQTQGQNTPKLRLLACGLTWGFVFFCLGLAFAIPFTPLTTWAWAQGPAYFAGTIAACTLCHSLSRIDPLPTNHNLYMLACAFGLLGLVALPIFYPTFWPGKYILAGWLEALGMAGIALSLFKTATTTPLLPLKHAAVTLLLILAAVNGGTLAGNALARAKNHSVIFEPLLLLLCAGLLLGIGLYRRYLGTMHPAPGKPPEVPPATGRPSGPRHSGPIALAGIPKDTFTEKEQAIAVLMLQGFTNSAIAKATGITENTVRWHIKNLYKKTGTANRQELAAMLSGNTGNKSA
ncbi:helix-turn-helix domain-containing protein [Desulfovibrio cuneatus]|uniref:helix-turn-helix domain-containing protein n=1 Tax=Desulfovibrio cuneatus TaxID=159728 RepID=UPI0004124E7F|nr:helix-turn-helix transcriptional regulator [Desulfovibrio cuneatus]